MRDDKFTTTSVIVILHPSVGPYWVMYTNEEYFDSYGCPLPLNRISQIHNFKFRKLIFLWQRIVYMCYILHA